MRNNNPILAIETSGEVCSVAFYNNDIDTFELNFLRKNIHSEKIFNMIEYCRANFGTQLSDIDSIAISYGPGSFTGLRIGMTVAKSIAMGLKRPIIPVPTFDAAALQLTLALPEKMKFCILKKASINDFYYAKYLSDGNTYQAVDNLQLILKEEVEKKVSDADIVYADNNNLLFAKKIVAPTAYYVAKWANEYGKKVTDFDYLEPLYLKKFITREKNEKSD
ncbi:tRNA (adenosine(37)-N6)-threonylcarbamoyltransferase complex dimerization subunit type 1 TsaB [Melioribacter sp. OK-6-Me]|uniref:tRNA (adenosine(37)-N6)-threonylcarbamoyltransferase complex dimerization subunit type 1 TsaB n=1 Tax=unclassified Melioribacter TaxID=2627329 RepID=UPI003ED8D6E8